MPELDWTAALTAAEIVRCGCRRSGLAMSASACGDAQADPAPVGMANASQSRSISAAGTLVSRRERRLRAGCGGRAHHRRPNSTAGLPPWPGVAWSATLPPSE